MLLKRFHFSLKYYTRVFEKTWYLCDLKHIFHKWLPIYIYIKNTQYIKVKKVKYYVILSDDSKCSEIKKDIRILHHWCLFLYKQSRFYFCTVYFLFLYFDVMLLLTLLSLYTLLNKEWNICNISFRCDTIGSNCSQNISDLQNISDICYIGKIKANLQREQRSIQLSKLKPKDRGTYCATCMFLD